jgi:hypothetical protein
MCPLKTALRCLIGIIVCVTPLTPLSGSVVSGERHPVERRSGYWLRRVGDNLLACESHSQISAWTWTKGPSPLLRTIDGAGTKVEEWSLDQPIQTIKVNKNCSLAWILSRDTHHLYSLNRNIDRDPRGLSRPTSEEIINFLPATDANSAWIVLSGKPGLMLALRGATGISLHQVPNLGARMEVIDIALASEGKKVWVVTRSLRGLLIADASGAREYTSLRSNQIGAVTSSNHGQVGWAIAIGEDNGVFVVDDRGSLIEHLLPREEVLAVFTGPEKEYAWIKTRHEDIYLAKATVVSGKTHVRLLNQGKPVGSEGDVLRLEALAVTGDGRHAWALPPGRFQSNGIWNVLWFLEVIDDEVKATKIDDRRYDSKPLRNVWGDGVDLSHAWLQTYDLSIYDVSAAESTLLSHPILDFAISSLLVNSLEPAGAPGRLLIGAPNGSYLMGSASDLAEAELDLGEETLALASKTPSRLHPPGSLVKVHLAWKNGSPLPDDSPGVIVGVRDPRSRDPLRRGEAPLVNDRAEVPLPGYDQIPWDRPLKVVLLYRDARGSLLGVRWLDVSFSPAWYLRLAGTPYPWVFLGYLVVLAISSVLFYSLLSRSRTAEVEAARWIPVVSIAATFALPELAKASWMGAAALAALMFAIPLGAAAAAPRVLRALAPLQPYSLMVKLLLSRPRIKMRVYGDYVDQVRRELKYVRLTEGNNEVYVSLPLKLVDSPQAGSSEVELPELVAALHPSSGTSEPRSVLLEAPGGRGKSAVLREVVLRCLDRFAVDPREPLPVIVSPREVGAAADLVRSGLGRYALPRELLESQVAGGTFVLFIDGLQEGSSGATQLAVLFGNPDLSVTPLCIATRPSREAHSLARKMGWLIVEPQLLLAKGPNDESEGTVHRFIREYAAADTAGAGQPRDENCERVLKGSTTWLPICQSSEGVYLPLLVRLCMVASDKEVRTVAEIYDAALRKLLERSGLPAGQLKAVFGQIEDLCVEVFWTNHERSFPIKTDTDQRAEAVQAFLGAGIIVSADREITRLRSTPKEGRLFHDSMLSYLTACGLDRTEKYSALLRASGDPSFSRHDSDGDRSLDLDLFSMCLNVFSPAGLRNYLKPELTAWAVRFGKAFSIEEVQEALPATARDGISQFESCGLKEYLIAAIDSAMSLDEKAGSARSLGAIYGRLAPTVWRRLQQQGPYRINQAA